MALTNEDLKAIGSLMDEKLDSRFIPVERRLSAIEVDVSRLKSDMIEVKGDVAELKSDVAAIKTDVAQTQKTVNKHYQMFEESYVHQAEENTRVWNQFRIIAAQLEMQSKQIEFNNVRLNNG